MELGWEVLSLVEAANVKSVAYTCQYANNTTTIAKNPLTALSDAKAARISFCRTKNRFAIFTANIHRRNISAGAP
nr:hypothetical protein [Ruthenibacterium lactatiformans]